jgi:hypothetical protein
LSLTNLSTKRQRIAELARSKRGVALSTLHHVIDLEWMKEAYRLTRKDGAPGIDGVTAADYATNLEANLLNLLDRIKSGRYQAPPVRRVYIPKSDGSLRPLGLERVRAVASFRSDAVPRNAKPHRLSNCDTPHLDFLVGDEPTSKDCCRYRRSSTRIARPNQIHD